jgi:hypothetical protein
MGERALYKQQAEKGTERTVLKDGSLCYRTSKFTTVITRLAPGFVLVTGLGYNDGHSAPLITAEMTLAIPEQGKLVAFVNLAGETGQASVARDWWAAWVKHNRPRLGSTHILVRSKVMDMAISVLGMIIGGGNVKAYSNVASFEAMIKEHVPAFVRLPTFPDLPPMLP